MDIKIQGDKRRIF